MNLKLLEHLYMTKFRVEKRIEELRDNPIDASSPCAGPLRENDLYHKKMELSSINEILDIIFWEE